MLFSKANEPKQNLWVEKAGHNDLVGAAADSYNTAIKNFADSPKR
jgi:hypothetical protein